MIDSRSKIRGLKPSFLMPKLLKNILFTLWYIFYIRQSYLYLIFNPEQNLMTVTNQYIHGAYLLIWPITLCHLESFRTKGELLNFDKKLCKQFNRMQRAFVLPLGLLQCLHSGL